jgi:hypothetical protein
LLGDKKYYSIDAEKLIARGNVIFTGATLLGQAAFEHAKIGGYLTFDKATLSGSWAEVLELARAEIEVGVILAEASITGVARFYHARMSYFAAQGASFQPCKADKAEEGGLDFECATIEDALWLCKLKVFNGTLDLRSATTRIFADDGTAWPERGKLLLDKFSYERLRKESEADLEAGKHEPKFSSRNPPRLQWLKLQPEIDWNRLSKPQPWRQAVNALRDMDNLRDASTIARFARSRYRRRGDISRFEKVAYWVEAYPVLITTLILVYMLISGCVFQTAYEKGFITQVSKSDSAALSSDFNALLYTADVFIPVVNFGQRQNWEVHNTAESRPLATAATCGDHGFSTSPVTTLSNCAGSPILTLISSVPAGLLYYQAVANAFSWFFLTLLLAFLGGWAQSIFRPREDLTV